MNKEELDGLRGRLLDQCYHLSILKNNAGPKKKKAILDNLLISVINADLTPEEVEDCIKDVEKDEVINLEFFKKGGNLFEDYVKPKWRLFARELFTQRSVGLGTPNAASGEGELMFLFLSKNIKKPTRGDLKIGNEIMELKGNQDIRVMGEIRGKDFRIKTLKVCSEFKLTPNNANLTNIPAAEIEKFQHLSYWNQELKKLSLQKQKEFINKWLGCLDDRDHRDSVERIFNKQSFDQLRFIKEIIKILYATMVRIGNFDKFIILSDDAKKAKIISKDVNDFNKKVDNGEIIPVADYFRINQNFNVGWYIS